MGFEVPGKVRMGVHWTVLYVLQGTEGRGRQWDLKCQARYVWESTGLSYTSCKVQRDGIDSGI